MLAESEGEVKEYSFINRPIAKEHTCEYKPPPPSSNPVLRGLPLYYLAELVASSTLVQNILWSLNGFGKLRARPELDDVEPRYAPDVIRTSPDATVFREGDYLNALSSEDWTSRAPPKAAGERKVLRSVLDYHEAYRSGEVTPVDVVEALLPLVRQDGEGKEGRNSRHATAFACVRAEMVRKAAEESAERWRAGQPRSVVDGVVMAVKDEVDLTAHTRSLGSRMDFRSSTDATSFCVQKWLDAGAICLGKTLMHEMGMDTTTNNPVHGTPRNPYNDRYYCGGSSGGSAYAVAAGLVPFAMGNDGGGSIRIPAAYCGLFGLKTSHGRISQRPTVNLAQSTGVAGPLAANMVDLEIAYRIMAEPDPQNPSSATFAPRLSVPPTLKRRKPTLAICHPWFDRADTPVHDRCTAALSYLAREHGYKPVSITLPLLHEGQLAHAITIMTEVLSGCPPSVLKNLTPANKILLSVASRTSSLDFLQAQRLRNLLMQHLAHLFAEHGEDTIIVTPTTPNAGWSHREADLGPYGVSDGNMQLRNMEYAFLANFTGCPALTAPVGYLPGSVGKGPVPVGLMGMAEWGNEEGLLEFGYDLERWVHEGLEGGKTEARGGVDVWGLVRGERG